MLAWQVLFLSASSSRMHMPGLCACERERKRGRGPGFCDWAPRSCRENQVLDDEISAWRDDGGIVVEADRMRKRPIRMLRAESHRVGGPPLSRFGPRHPVGSV